MQISVIHKNSQFSFFSSSNFNYLGWRASFFFFWTNKRPQQLTGLQYFEWVSQSFVSVSLIQNLTYTLMSITAPASCCGLHFQFMQMLWFVHGACRCSLSARMAEWPSSWRLAFVSSATKGRAASPGAALWCATRPPNCPVTASPSSEASTPPETISRHGNSNVTLCVWRKSCVIWPSSHRSPPLTLLHLSAGKFNDAPSAAGSIAGFLSSDVASTQRKPASQPASDAKNQLSSKQAGSIQSFFKKAAEKQKLVIKEEDDSAPLTEALSSQKTSGVEIQSPTNDNSCSDSSNTHYIHSKNQSGSSLSISSFFHKKTLEKSLNESASPLKTTTMEHTLVTTEDTEGAAVELELAGDQSQSEDQVGFDPEANHQPLNVASEDLLKCERCGKEVLVWEMPEHTDYHFALDLQKSLSASTTSGNSTGSSSPAAAVARSHRGKTKSRGQSGPQSKKARNQSGGAGTLDSFFKRNWRQIIFAVYLFLHSYIWPH